MSTVFDTPTPFGSILDVDGVRVGHHQRIGRGWQTGTTVVACPAGATPGVDVRGGGPGTRETDALRPENLVSEIHGVCLTGGSAFGLAAADGVMAEFEAAGRGVAVGDGLVVPVVPTAVIFDLARGGRATSRPDASFGRRAAATALRGLAAPRWGSVGAGAGARAGGLQGGVGTASTSVTVPLVVPDPTRAPEPDPPAVTFRVGALAVVNAHGSVVDPATGLPWIRPGRGWKRQTADVRDRLAEIRAETAGRPLNTTIGVVATDARLERADATKVADVAHDGLARAIRPAHSLVDGDTVFSLATGVIDWPAEFRVAVVNALCGAAAEAFAAACTHALVAAVTVGEAPAWRDVVDG